MLSFSVGVYVNWMYLQTSDSRSFSSLRLSVYQNWGGGGGLQCVNFFFMLLRFIFYSKNGRFSFHTFILNTVVRWVSVKARIDLSIDYIQSTLVVFFHTNPTHRNRRFSKRCLFELKVTAMWNFWYYFQINTSPLYKEAVTVHLNPMHGK